MLTVKIKNIEIGKGMPKICVPLTGATKDELFSEISALDGKPCDIVEWRADYLGEYFSGEQIIELLPEIRERLVKRALLFTFRTAEEGGEKAVGGNEYFELNSAVIEGKLADIVDVELSLGEGLVKTLVYNADKKDMPILMSSHDLSGTPAKEAIIKRFCKMQDLGASITRIAVMPVSMRDVVALFSAMVEMQEVYADKPYIAVCMSKMGLVSRVIGEVFGSSIAFGSLKKSTAPGQICIDDLHTVMKLMHKYI